MKIVILIARLLLGLISVVFGLNGFLNFLSMGPMPTGLAGYGLTSSILAGNTYKAFEMAPKVLWLIAFYSKRQYFSGTFAQRT
jgi:putative oxidoreductase